MKNTTVTIKVDNRELVNSKFTKTLAVVEGYFREARGGVSVNQSYTANAVYRRMEAIKEALESDLKKLSQDISVTHSSDPE
jgi:hypothetical protein